MTRFRMKRKIGDDLVGKHRMMIEGNLRVIRPGDIIECEKKRLEGVLDKFEQLDPEPTPAPEKPRQKLILEKRPGGNFTGYDVINSATGKAINSEPLKKAEAEALIEEGLADDTGDAGYGDSNEDRRSDDDSTDEGGSNGDSTSQNEQ